MKEEKILTLHPKGKSGKSIDKKKYDLVKDGILSTLKNKSLTHTEMMDQLSAHIKQKFEGNMGWYAETVKLDLEARKIIERTDDKPARYRTI